MFPPLDLELPWLEGSYREFVIRKQRVAQDMYKTEIQVEGDVVYKSVRVGNELQIQEGVIRNIDRVNKISFNQLPLYVNAESQIFKALVLHRLRTGI